MRLLQTDEYARLIVSKLTTASTGRAQCEVPPHQGSWRSYPKVIDGRPRSETRFYKLRGTAESHNADANAPTHTVDERFQQEIGEPQGSFSAAFCMV